MPGGKTKTLSLCEKYQLIEEHEQQKRPARELAVAYGVGKTQVYETLKNKEKIKNELMSGTSGQRKRLAYAPLYEDINNAIWEWLCSKHAEGLQVSGTMIQAQALKVAKELNRHEFKASNGWLDSFKSRHNIVCNVNNREVHIGDKDVIVMIEEEVWKQNIPDLTAGYSEENIFVAFETGLCYKSLSSSFDCSEKLGILLCMNMKGTLLKPLVVGKLARPKAFGKLDVNTLPVHWRPSAHACLTTFLLEEWLNFFNELMVAEERRVVLVLHIQSCNSNVSLSNVKVVRCPQALDPGVILYFKGLYRKNLLQTVLLKLHSSVVMAEPGAVKVEPSAVAQNVRDVCSSISLLDAVNWISRASSAMSPDLVRTSLVSSGFVPLEGVVVPVDVAETNLRAEIYELCERVNCDPEEVLRFDDDVTDDPLQIKVEESEPMQGEEELDVNTYSAAIRAVNNLEKFAAHKNCPQLLSLLQDAKEALTQSCLDF